MQNSKNRGRVFTRVCVCLSANRIAGKLPVASTPESGGQIPKFGVEETLVSFLLITRIRAYVVTIYISMAFHPSPRHILCFMRFVLYTVCKTLRLSVFNKELFD